MQNNHKQDKGPENLVAAFQRAAGKAGARFDYLITQYPSKAAAISGAAADGLFLYQSSLNGNVIGGLGALIGLYACAHLGMYGDPKITAGQKEQYVDPQDKRDIVNWFANPKQYPWEFTGLLRMTFMGAMFVGGLGVARSTPISWGEVTYSSAALMGYAVKMGIAEKEKGTAVVPEDAKGFMKFVHKAKAYVQENPNPTAGRLWLAGLIPYTLEGMIKAEPFKVASAALYLLPDVLTMMSSKRARELPPSPPPENPHL